MVDKHTFLRRYLAWCQDQVRSEIEMGMPDLGWVGHPVFGFLVSYLREKTTAQANELFSAMLHSKLYHLGLKWDGAKKARHEAVLDEYIRASRQYRSRRMQDPAEALRTATFKTARASAIKPMVWKDLKSHGWQKIPWNPGILKCSKNVEHATVYTFLSAETKDFSYWHQVVDGSGECLMETSYAEWFGLGYYTLFTDNEEGSENKISEFVAAKCQLFTEASRSLLESVDG